MVVFLDTSAIYALADRDDPNHPDAVRRFDGVLKASVPLLVHNYVILESTALLQRRLGWKAVRRFLTEVDSFQIRWVDETLHRAARARFVSRRRRVSLVDEVSFLVMREAQVRHVLAFDEDFAKEGFLLYFPGSR